MRSMSLPLVTLLTVSMYTAAAPDPHESCVSSIGPVFVFSISAATSAARPEAAMQINSNSISPGGEFPKRETCDGGDSSPQLSWSGAPPNTQSFALILDDPDAPSGTFTHWIAWNVPASARELAENLPKSAQLPDGTRQGRNDFGKAGYGGPCPPPGKAHRYFFRLYALDNLPAVKAGAGRGELEHAMEGHVLARGELMGRYGR
jgi:Raf kinase inhibitor-like YbhB/YbcL family protein